MAKRRCGVGNPARLVGQWTTSSDRM